MLRRARSGALRKAPALSLLRDGDLAIDLKAHEVRRGAGLVSLPSREYDLLAFLMAHPRRAFTREALLEQVWNWAFGDPSTVTVHVRRLQGSSSRPGAAAADPHSPGRGLPVRTC